MEILTEKSWSLIKKINRDWNDKIQYESDSQHYHKTDHWEFPLDLKGDCEDYAIAKKQALESHGIESHFACCWVETGGYHAVLIIQTDKGDFVLDNRYDEVRNYADLPYLWHRIERSGKWYEIL